MTNVIANESISNADIVGCITTSAQEVFSTMLGMEVVSEEIPVPKAVAGTPAAGIISLIGITGPWAGTGSLSCNAEFACLLASKLLMDNYSEVNDEVLDAVAEITNMIIGNVKTTLEQKVGDLGLSTPTVIYGLNFQTRSAQTHKWVGVKFACDALVLSVLMCLVEASSKSERGGLQFPQISGI
jgi:chemotaxis protein CheX